MIGWGDCKSEGACLRLDWERRYSSNPETNSEPPGAKRKPDCSVSSLWSCNESLGIWSVKDYLQVLQVCREPSTAATVIGFLKRTLLAPRSFNGKLLILRRKVDILHFVSKIRTSAGRCTIRLYSRWKISSCLTLKPLFAFLHWRSAFSRC